MTTLQNPNPDYRSKPEETTFIIKLRTADLPTVRVLIEAYGPSLPPKLKDIFDQFLASIPEPKSVTSQSAVRPYGDRFGGFGGK